MSHFEDVEPLFWGDEPSGCGPIGAAIFIVAIVWAASADSDSKRLCEEHGEKYVYSREAFTLCEQDGGTVVRRGEEDSTR